MSNFGGHITSYSGMINVEADMVIIDSTVLSQSSDSLDVFVAGLFDGLNDAHKNDSDKLNYLRSLRDNTQFGYKKHENFPRANPHSYNASESLGNFMLGYIKGTEYQGPEVIAKKID